MQKHQISYCIGIAGKYLRTYDCMCRKYNKPVFVYDRRYLEQFAPEYSKYLHNFGISYFSLRIDNRNGTN
jgi:hypothetical protein